MVIYFKELFTFGHIFQQFARLWLYALFPPARAATKRYKVFWMQEKIKFYYRVSQTKAHQQSKQKWPNIAGLPTFQSGPKGSKRVQNGQPRCFWSVGTLLGPSGPFWTISNKKMIFCSKHFRQSLLCPVGAKKIIFNDSLVGQPTKTFPKYGLSLHEFVIFSILLISGSILGIFPL